MTHGIDITVNSLLFTTGDAAPRREGDKSTSLTITLLRFIVVEISLSWCMFFKFRNYLKVSFGVQRVIEKRVS